MSSLETQLQNRLAQLDLYLEETAHPRRRIFGFSAGWVYRALLAHYSSVLSYLKLVQSAEQQLIRTRELEAKVASLTKERDDLKARLPKPEPGPTYDSAAAQKAVAYASVEDLLFHAQQVPVQQIAVIGKNVAELKTAQDEILFRLNAEPAATKFLYLRLPNGTELRFLSAYSVKNHFAARGLSFDHFFGYNLPNLSDAVWAELEPCFGRSTG
jgi:hypothetical protein